MRRKFIRLSWLVILIFMVAGFIIAEEKAPEPNQNQEEVANYIQIKETIIPKEECLTLRIMEMKGSLIVTGLADKDQIVVRILSDTANDISLNEVEVITEKLGDELWLEINWPSPNMIAKNSYRIEIELPQEMNLILGETNELVQIAKIAGLDLNSRGGKLDISLLSGPVRIRDNGGNINLREVNGDVWISDAGGDMLVEGIVGLVTIDSDTFINLVMQKVVGDVTVSTRLGGLVDIKNIEGNVSVFSRGPLTTKCDAISGSLMLPEDINL
jgi:hypothetical protein